MPTAAFRAVTARVGGGTWREGLEDACSGLGPRVVCESQKSSRCGPLCRGFSPQQVARSCKGKPEHTDLWLSFKVVLVSGMCAIFGSRPERQERPHSPTALPNQGPGMERHTGLQTLPCAPRPTPRADQTQGQAPWEASDTSVAK